MFKTVSLMAMGAGAYIMYDKYGKKAINKLEQKANKAINKTMKKINEVL